MRIAAAVLALPMAAGLAACGELNQAQQGFQDANQQIQDGQRNLDNAQACVEALNTANFVPNFADPQQAQRDAQAKVQELQRLAERTRDETLKQNLLDVQQSVRQVAEGKVSIDSSDDWVAGQLDKYQAVTTTCSELSG